MYSAPSFWKRWDSNPSLAHSMRIPRRAGWHGSLPGTLFSWTQAVMVGPWHGFHFSSDRSDGFMVAETQAL